MVGLDFVAEAIGFVNFQLNHIAFSVCMEF